MKNGLTKKEENFCRYFSGLQNAGQAAYLAGYRVLPVLAGEKLLARTDVTDRIEKLNSAKRAVSGAAEGFRRIAFGSVADAVRLVDGERSDLDALDLFMVSDIKIPKGGGMEIKFFDRIKALENLAALESVSDSQGPLPFYSALENAAKQLGERNENIESR